MKHPCLSAALIALAVASLCFFLIAVVFAAPGDLDTTFAGTGKTRLGFGFGIDRGNAVAVQPADGKIVMAGSSTGDFAVVRYNTDGSLDTSFDGDGKVVTIINGSSSVATAVKIQGDGKIVVAGYVLSAPFSTLNSFAVVRYNSDGSLDTSFDGDGKVTTAFGASDAKGNALAIQADSKIVVAGSSRQGSNSDFAVARYNTDGSPDTSFDLDGQLTTPIGTGDDVGNAVTILSGKIIVAGSSLNGLKSDFAVVRYNSDGSPDTSFDIDGKVTTPVRFGGDDVGAAVAIQFGNGTILQPDKIVVAGSSSGVTNQDFAIVRYNLDGSLDTSFDTDGKVTTPVGTGADRASAVTIQGGGTNPRKIIVAGTSDSGAFTKEDFAVVRYNSDGSLDTSFDIDGKVTTAVDTNFDRGAAVALQADGKIVVAGSSLSLSSSFLDDFAVVRYNSNGSLDTSFDGDGKRTDTSDAAATAKSVAMQTDGKIVVAGFKSGGNFAVLRCNSDGSADTSFDGDGRVITPVGTTAAFGNAVAMQTDGKIVVAGFSSGGFTVVRYNTDGSLDTSFDIDGKVTTPIGLGTAVAIQADGKIVVAGVSGSDIAVVRYNSSGSLDTSFDGDGIVTTGIGNGGDEVGNAVAIQTDGKIVVAGSDDGNFALVRYNSNGSLDNSFDDDGIVSTAIVVGFEDAGNAVAIQTDGKIVVAGSSRNGLTSDSWVARYNSNGSPDVSFNGSGKVIETGGRVGNGVAIQADGRIIVAGFGSSSIGGPSDFVAVRYNSNGSLDSSYGSGGKVVVDLSGGGNDEASAIALDSTGRAVVAGTSAGSFGVMRLLAGSSPTPTPTPTPASVQFSTASYSKNESGPSTNITVTRAGDTSGAASVDFRTGNNSYVPCNVVNGATTQNCDFIISSGTLNFAPGQASRSFPIIIIDDLYVEGNETLSLSLSNPVGMVLGASTATLTIIDNDSVTPTTNPLDDPQFFVREHYYDFLGRLPDQGGLDFWTNEITQCGTNPTCINNKRVDVSNAFFFEQEYQQTASFVFLLYRASFGNDQPFPNPDFFDANLSASLHAETKKLPRYLSFARDRAQVVGGSDLAQTQLALANAFVQRPEFVTKYPLSLAVAAQFVDAVLATIRNDSGAELVSQRDTLIGHFNVGGRGLVLFHLANDYWNGCNRLPGSPPAPCVPVGFGAAVDNRLFIDAEYNRSFVYSQYSGYLRRDGDIGGFLFWLNQVSTAPLRNVSKQHAMVCSFITAEEYQRRFSSVVTHTNAECAP